MGNQNVIVLRSLYGKTQGKIILNPVKDRSTNKLRGVKQFDPTEALKQVKIVDENTTRTITDGSRFDLDDKVDAIDWAWVKENACINGSLEDSYSNPAGLFYVYDEFKGVQEKADRNRILAKAMNYVYGLDKASKIEVLMYLGSDPESLSDIDMENILIDRAKTKPSTILDIAKDSDFKTRIFLFRLVNTGKIKQDQNGFYRYGDMVLGLNQTQAIIWLNDKNNREIVGKLYSQIYGIENDNLPSSVVEDFEKLSETKSNKKVKDNAGDLGKAGEATTVDSELQSVE